MPKVLIFTLYINFIGNNFVGTTKWLAHPRAGPPVTPVNK